MSKLREKIEALLALEKEARGELGTRKRVKWLDWTTEIQDFSPHLLRLLLALLEVRETARELTLHHQGTTAYRRCSGAYALASDAATDAITEAEKAAGGTQ